METESDTVDDRLKKLESLKLLLKNVDTQLLFLVKELNWDYQKLLEENPSEIVTCTIDSNHRVPAAKIESHKEKCLWHHQGYREEDKLFPEYSGAGSCVTLTSETIQSITSSSSSNSERKLRAVPQSTSNLDQNFSREEKLAIYDYVISNTQKQNSYSDLWLEPTKKTEEKKEMTAWEIAAAERDAKRRRASYRNKVHTNRKTHTEILREVIESQMETLKGVAEDSNKPETSSESKSGRHYPEETSWNTKRHREDEKSSNRESAHHRVRDDRDESRHRSHHKKSRKSSPDHGNDTRCRSRSEDKYRKWKNNSKSYCNEGRSHYRRSSK